MKPTLCDPRLRTFGKVGGKWPECGSAEDQWRSTPWRAPGSAPVLDACGMAGGTPTETHSGAQYFPTPNGRQGDLGSKMLKPLPTGTVWTAGSMQNVSWAINANHGLSSIPLRPSFACYLLCMTQHLRNRTLQLFVTSYTMFELCDEHLPPTRVQAAVINTGFARRHGSSQKGASRKCRSPS
eukprot:COSAG01_NODE_19862_length_985_cov_1.182844_1_plen_182_part_00